MPGRGRGRGLKGTSAAADATVGPPPVLSAEQRALLESDHPPSATSCPGQFEDAKKEKEINGTNHIKSSDQISESSKPVHENESNTEKPAASESESTPPKTTTPPSDGSGLKLKSTLNANAAVFVPKSMELFSGVGAASLEQPAQTDYPQPVDMVTPAEILDSFVHKSKGDVPLLLSAATMLLEASSYPASFDTHLMVLCHLLENTAPTDEVLEDLVEMLVTWGIGDDTVRYTAIKMNDYICKLSIKEKFRPKLFKRLQERYLYLKSKEYNTPEDVSELIETTLYIAEMFYRVRIKNDDVVWVLGSAAIELVFILLHLRTNETVVKACNVIKLIGYLLQYKTQKTKDFNPTDKLDTALSILRQLSVDDSMSSHASEVILSVMTLSGKKWGIGTAPLMKPSLEAPLFETPVGNIQEWEDFVDESGYVIEGVDDLEPTVYFDDQDDPNIDEEMMKEYEDFVQDFEDHLMMQEFGQ